MEPLCSVSEGRVKTRKMDSAYHLDAFRADGMNEPPRQQATRIEKSFTNLHFCLNYAVSQQSAVHQECHLGFDFRIMPIYEYEPLDPKRGCENCIPRLEIIQKVDEARLSKCPYCGQRIRKVISWCRAAVVETPDEQARIEQQVTKYENEGMWSHAAELADKHSEKSKDRGMKMRALDDYKKAGYDVDSLEKHIKKSE
jgi:putative FmdB family regulatory protein